MICCTNCFSDQGLKKRIAALSTTIGDCDFCDSKGYIVIDCTALSVAFEQLFDLYGINDVCVSLGHREPMVMHLHMANYWPRLFNTMQLNQKMIKQLVNQIGRGWEQYSDELFNSPVEFIGLFDFSEGKSQNLQMQWDLFSDEIKRKNRFFLGEKIDTEILESIFARLVIHYPVGYHFYRARISDSHLLINELGKPLPEYATPGRANPVGIPYLYLSDSENTTLYETRVALHEGITVGKFVTNETINVVSLKNIADFGPFEIRDRGFDIEEFILVRPYLERLEQELSWPVRKQDVHLDYLPTQYLCEFIKSLHFDGVEYKSAMNSTGYNLAIFNDRKFNCMESAFFRITNLKYDAVPS